MYSALKKADCDGANLALAEIEALLSIDEAEALNELFAIADRVRKRELGDEIWLRGLLEFSNHCSCNCFYCGLRRGNSELERYRMTANEILAVVNQISAAGIGTVVLQSGEDSWWTVERLAELIKRIKTTYDIAVTLSVGSKTRKELELLRKAGADRYLIRHETANEELYNQLHPDSTLKDRVKVLYDLKELGYEIGTGCMVGLPGQTTADLAQDILLARKLDVDMFGVGPFIPHPDTPLCDEKAGTIEMAYKVIAVARIVLCNAHIPVTTALATLDADGREKGWQRGANVVMPIATPSPYRQQYELYKDKRCIDDTLMHCRSCLVRRIASVNRNIGKGYGGSIKKRGVGIE